MNIGMNIKKYRKVLGLTQTQLGEKVGVSQKLIADYETNSTKPPLDRIIIFAQVFSITTDQLLGLEQASIIEPEIEKREHGNSRVMKMNKLFKELSEDDQKSVLKIVRKMV